ncbi:prolyl oligopeptidase family serine peptidase [Pendulispora albinea]|uniref:prolyl oligopeptidase n=1 Tax=Pendulispora albinea TaxID=2741071 RepID=A0ABZ2LSA8_9BACT
MRASRFTMILAAAGMACGGSSSEPPSAPVAQATPPASPSPSPAPEPATKRPAYPPTAKRPQTIEVARTSFRDDYAWLRNPADPEVTKWIDAQNDFTTASLATYPHLDALRARFQELTRRSKPTFTAIERSRLGYFALRRAPSAPQPSIVLVPSLDEPESLRVVLDPAVLDPTGQTAIDWYTVSADGKRIAVSLSKGGSEDGSLSIFDTATGKLVDGPLPRVQFATAGGSAAFSGDGKTIFCTRYPAPGERAEADLREHQQLYRHTIGAPVERDERVPIELPAIAEIKLERATAGGTIVARVNVGDGGDVLWFIGQPSAKGYTWSRFAGESDAIAAVDTTRDALFAISRRGDARGAIVRVPLRAPKLSEAKVIVPPSERELRDVSVAGDALVVFDIARGSTRARAFDLSGKLRGDVKLPERSSVHPATAASDGALYVSVVSYTEPLSVQRLDARKLELQTTPLVSESAARFDDVEILDDVATSRDGTKVPITILAVRGTPRSPSTPLLLTGYGGFGVPMQPAFEPRRRVWLDQGGIIAIAHLRGGSDNGEAWHTAGKLGRKQNVFDDFIASAERVVAAGYTSPAKLAITGRSNGGLLMGAVLTQRPDLARAAAIGVPVLDMARSETWPNGRFNAPEFGSVHDPDMAPKLLAYSPYQNAKPAAYPSVLLISGATDGRVNPADARAFTAKLQDLTTSSAPVLLRTWMDSGHGMGTNVFKRAEEDAQTYAFLLRELHVAYRKAKAP